jgi:hypothetical protein
MMVSATTKEQETLGAQRKGKLLLRDPGTLPSERRVEPWNMSIIGPRVEVILLQRE